MVAIGSAGSTREMESRRIGMAVDSVRLIYFSPTRTTQKIVSAIGEGLQSGSVEHLDLTLPGAESRVHKETRSGLAVIGVPVYGGRVPLLAIERLSLLTALNTPAVIVVVYGNRAYDDAMLELRNLAVERGFVPFAAGAFIAEHSYATEKMPIANGRPDKEDLEKAREYGKIIRKRLEQIDNRADLRPLTVPGNLPYKERSPRHRGTPITHAELCTRCERCVGLCPMGAIAMEGVAISDAGKCIICCACVKLCPERARVLTDEHVRKRAEAVSLQCQERKEPELHM
jgi:ferredoxin